MTCHIVLPVPCCPSSLRTGGTIGSGLGCLQWVDGQSSVCTTHIAASEHTRIDHQGITQRLSNTARCAYITIGSECHRRFHVRRHVYRVLDECGCRLPWRTAALLWCSTAEYRATLSSADADTGLGQRGNPCCEETWRRTQDPCRLDAWDMQTDAQAVK